MTEGLILNMALRFIQAQANHLHIKYPPGTFVFYGKGCNYL